MPSAARTRTRFLAFAFALAATTAGPAAAVPVSLTLAPAADGQNRVGFVGTTSSPLGPLSLPGSSDLSGTIDLDVGFTGSAVTSVRLLDTTDVGLSDVTLSALGLTVLETTGVRGTITSGEIPLNQTGNFDLGGATLSLDEGFVDAIGDDPGNNDLAGNPLVLTLASGDFLNLAAVDAGGGLFVFTLSGPVSFAGRVDDDPVIDVTVAGNLLATGSAVVPEPGTLALVASGCLLVMPRKWSRRRTG
ncbi:hypothetical protein [Phycisphaera mikurensis]|uniref:PEP-CTERM protein-sorting domain-containing protein n=1 Tax=Phycisphaera mikurensis (strain NBRC 102666 / KCTC 22515 / FYK2301M01) TaxID=1142394 RepID=I0IEI7_PHYMF|nr:hypothetical protein [Phycisphaera mikurensis]MBB6441474.1 hypothetical protein [Phycisphaera mikurensis]BAM03675.1 hypothetical protein PSMK_15160 [Phycisphaera mikurensis NBRC 102666]